MPNHSHVTCVGHLGRNADVKAVGDRFVINFSVAVSRKRKDLETTTWWNVNYWTKSDALAQYLTKGTPVLVSGEPHVRKYEKKDGGSGESLEIDAAQVQLLGGREKQEPSATAAQPAQTPRKPAPAQDDPENTVPF